MTKGGFHLDIGDGRGWGATKSCIATPSVNGRDWIPVSCTYAPLKDNPGATATVSWWSCRPIPPPASRFAGNLRHSNHSGPMTRPQR